MELLRIQNIKTTKVYDISPEGWDKIKAQGWESRYSILDRRKVIDPEQPTFLPDEIRKSARDAAEKAIADGLKESKPAGNAPAQM